MFCLEFSGLHYCLFVKVLFFLLEVFPEELSFLSFRQLIEFIISSSVCQELFSFCFQVSFKTRLLITRSNSSLVYQNFQLVSSIFYFLNFFSEIRVAFVRRNSHKVYQDCLSMSSTFSNSGRTFPSSSVARSISTWLLLVGQTMRFSASRKV